MAIFLLVFVIVIAFVVSIIFRAERVAAFRSAVLWLVDFLALSHFFGLGFLADFDFFFHSD